MKKIATLILSLGLSLVALAQNATVSGVVLDEQNQPIIGTFVVQQGTANGVTTGVDGDFSIKAPAGAVLEVTCIGYLPQNITVTGNVSDLRIVLADDNEMLEETIVIGYGVQK